MAAVRSADTGPERIVRSVLHRLGFRFRLSRSTLPGRPDIVLRRHRIAVFVHGCFWHAHSCKRGRSVPQTNAAFWRDKLAANVARDRKNAAALRRMGWRVVRVWECQLRDRAALTKRLAQLRAPKSR